MTAALVEQAHAKINLTLRVLGRRDDGYHELESLVAFADIADTLTLQPGPDTALDVTGPFAAASGKPADNLVLKALSALGGGVPGLKAGRFRLDKHIPAAAGIGGGSADAAAALRLLARVNGFSLDDARLMTAALHAGADVPVCLEQRTCIMTGVGERLSPPLHLPKLQAVLVNPGLPLATRDVFAAFKEMKSRPSPLSAVPRQPMALIEFLKAHGNDLTEAAIACAPVVGDVLKTLTGLPGAQLVRMSGSGPTCFAIFVSGTKAVTAAQILKTAHADWWVQPTGIG